MEPRRHVAEADHAAHSHFDPSTTASLDSSQYQGSSLNTNVFRSMMTTHGFPHDALSENSFLGIDGHPDPRNPETFHNILEDDNMCQNLATATPVEIMATMYETQVPDPAYPCTDLQNNTPQPDNVSCVELFATGESLGPLNKVVGIDIHSAPDEMDSIKWNMANPHSNWNDMFEKEAIFDDIGVQNLAPSTSSAQETKAEPSILGFTPVVSPLASAATDSGRQSESGKSATSV